MHACSAAAQLAVPADGDTYRFHGLLQRLPKLKRQQHGLCLPQLVGRLRRHHQCSRLLNNLDPTRLTRHGRTSHIGRPISIPLLKWNWN